MDFFLSLKKLNCSSETFKVLKECRRFHVEIQSSLIIAKEEFERKEELKVNSFLSLLEDEQGWVLIFDISLSKNNIERFLFTLEHDERIVNYILSTIPIN
jgi:hypothetical protein